jgi:predicted DNA-binding transcriptional regulator AlpA
MMGLIVDPAGVNDRLLIGERQRGGNALGGGQKQFDDNSRYPQVSSGHDPSPTDVANWKQKVRGIMTLKPTRDQTTGVTRPDHHQGMESPGDRLMSLVEVSQLLGIPVATMYGWRHRGEGPRGYRIGRHVR